MSTLIKLGLVGMMVVLLFSLPEQDPCDTKEGKETFVQDHLTSIPNPELEKVNPDDLRVDKSGGLIEVPTPAGKKIVQVEHLDMKYRSFTMRKRTKRDSSRILSQTLRTFRGQLTQFNNSLVALYIGKPDDGRPGFVSGYLISNTTNPTEASWYFIEPARPMMMGIAQRTSDIQVSKVDDCLKEEEPWHVIYRAGVEEAGDPFSVQLEPARDVKLVVNRLDAPFNIQLGASFDVKAQIANLTLQGVNADSKSDVRFFVDGTKVHEISSLTVERGESVEKEFTHSFDEPGQYRLTVRTEGNAMTRIINVSETKKPASFDNIPFLGVADAAFYDLYEEMSQKTWWEGLSEVTNLVDAFYGEQFDGLGFRIRALEAWTRGGPGGEEVVKREFRDELDEDEELEGSAINAYTVLCHYAQDWPKSVPKTAVDAPGLSHLFSGRDLGPIPDPMAISDTGDALCEANCSQVGANVVGLAEGLGGFRRTTARPPSCEGSLTEPQDLDPEAYHALSQHAPHEPTSPKLEESEKDANSKYQATLYHRFLLLAHEIGHNLGANHSPDKTTIMYTPLQNTIQFKLDSDEDGQNNEQEIRQWWR